MQTRCLLKGICKGKVVKMAPLVVVPGSIEWEKGIIEEVLGFVDQGNQIVEWEKGIVEEVLGFVDQGNQIVEWEKGIVEGVLGFVEQRNQFERETASKGHENCD